MPYCDNRHTTWSAWQPIPSAEEILNIEKVPFSNVRGAVNNYAKLRYQLYYLYGEEAVYRSGKISDKYFIAVIINGEFGLSREREPGMYYEGLEAVSNQYDDPASNSNNMTCEHSCTLVEQLQWASDVEGIYSGHSGDNIAKNSTRFESYLIDAERAMNHYVYGRNDSWMWGNVNDSQITNNGGIEYYDGHIITAKGSSLYPGYQWSIVWGWYPIP